jgi:hypothetical protein
MQFKFRPAIILFLTMLLAPVLTACGTENASNSDVVLPIIQTSNPNASPTASEICSNTLFPSRQGATWVYASTGGPGGAFIYTNSVTEARTDGFTLTTQFSDQTRTQEWSCQPDGLKALQLGGGSAAGTSIQGMTSELTTSNVNGLSLPQNVTTGMQWQYSLQLQGTIVMPGDPQAPANGVYSVTMQEMGRETITVPAGMFETIKIQSNSTVDILSSFGGADLPIKFNGTTMTWYAPGVGYVKVVENGDFGGEFFSSTTELQSYNIP